MDIPLLQSEVASLSPKVGYYDHERALLNAENVQLKQKLAALTQTQLLKEGKWCHSIDTGCIIVSVNQRVISYCLTIPLTLAFC